MKKYIMTVVLFTSIAAFAEQPCLAVFPAEKSNGKNVAYAAGPTLGMSLILKHGDLYKYLNSSGLPLKKIKVQYKKKDLENLEKKGVEIKIITREERKAGCPQADH